MVNFKEDERLTTLNHSCAHVMAQAVKHLYPHAKFWVGPVVKEGFYNDFTISSNDSLEFASINFSVFILEILRVRVSTVSFIKSAKQVG